MNEVWNLDSIYHSFQDPAFEADMNKLTQLSSLLQDLSTVLTAREPLWTLKSGIHILEEITEVTNKLAEYASLRQSTNTRDSEAGSKMGQIMQILGATAGPQALFQEWAAALPDLMDIVESDAALKEYRYFFENIQKDATHLLGAKGEEICARLSISGGSAWADLQQYLTSTVPVDYQGTVTNLSTIRNLAYDAAPSVRKAAYEAELACYNRIKDPVAHALNAIKMETISDCGLRGFASPLDRTLERSHMKRATLEAMLSAMDDYLPVFWKYLKTKGKVLGYENGLPWYELFAPMGSSSAKYTTEDAKTMLIQLFSTFDQELADMIQRAFEEAWIDFYPKDGKSGGAFCAGIECLQESRILTNFDGQFGDVVTLAHELGHAFHNQCIQDHRPLNHDYSMPVAETASTFNECVLMDAAIKNAESDGQRLALIESQLQDATQIICDIYSRYRFEKMVFENREARFMDADVLCEFMLEAQKQSYGDGLDPDVRHPYMWVCKSHYYGPTFYNFPYAFGGLFARGLFAQYEKEGVSFVPKYKKLLHTTPVASVEDTAKVAGIDLTDKAFWCSALQTIADQIYLFCKLVS